MSAPPAVAQQPYTRETIEQRIQRERDAAVKAEWAQIERVGKVVATALDAIGVALGEASARLLYDKAAGIQMVDEARECIVECAYQLRTARLSPDANQERKVAEAAHA